MASTTLGDPYDWMDRDTALALLRWHWGGAYRIDFIHGEYWATRRDDGSSVHRASAGQLRRAVIDDYTARPVPR